MAIWPTLVSGWQIFSTLLVLGYLCRPSPAFESGKYVHEIMLSIILSVIDKSNTIAFANNRFPSPHIAKFEPKSVKARERALVPSRRHGKGNSMVRTCTWESSLTLGTLSTEKPKLEKLKLLPRQLFPRKILPRQLFPKPATRKIEIPSFLRWTWAC